ncbi:SGNH/GDSL hydrolase family protein [Pedobacter frigidisoli]|uniref:SGNH/GDSL hydrolase family protein n=1 Tax=Pedobacter frigidisoli TaxID=2530455 RepID=UPI00292E7FAB|nr:SGNH/GDSL hydrolase family protein [Pedobacter frigidisoli]
MSDTQKTVQVITQDTSAQKTKFTYLALGDSYTIGESVSQSESFPYQLQELLKKNNFQVADPKIIAKTGWTTDELQTAIRNENLTTTFSFVTLLIGVNNQYREYPLSTYKKEFSELLQKAIAFAGGNKNRVFVVSIPDWGVTPFAKSSGRNPENIAKEIDEFNKANEEITLAAGANYTTITAASRRAKTDTSLIASDGLHPSAKMYGEWAQSLFSRVGSILK